MKRFVYIFSSGKKAFTLLELMLAVVLLGVMTTISILTFRAVTNGWRVSRDYMDRLERTDYSLDQLVSALKSSYYPHSGSQNGEYGFVLTDGGDGSSPEDSDQIEWSKQGSALVGSDSSSDAVHRLQLMVLEEGSDDWGVRIERTGLYVRVKPHAKVIISEDSTKEEKDFGFESDEHYRPILVASDIDGFDCRVLKDPPKTDNSSSGDSDWEDEFSESNAVPYKVQLTFYIEKEDPQYRSQKTRIPILRTVRIPVYEQSKDGATLPGSDKKDGGKTKKVSGGVSR
jgi:prepilin-type N-terminal cleavage/methylation domain-containing protein